MEKKERKLAPSIYFLKKWTKSMIENEDYSPDTFLNYTDESYNGCGRKDGKINLLNADKENEGYLHMPKFYMLFDNEDDITEDDIKLFLIGSFIFTNRRRYEEKIMWLDTLTNEKHFNGKLSEDEIVELVKNNGLKYGLVAGKKRVRVSRRQEKIAIKFDYEAFLEIFDCTLDSMEDDDINMEFKPL